MALYSQDFIERFWSHVDKTSQPEGCWEWTSALDKDGYGQIRTRRPERKWLKAHRVAWEICVGPIPEGLHVLHKPPCVNRKCVLHLYTGTNKDNIHDRFNAHPQKGALSHLAKLTNEDILEIRKLYASEHYTQAEIAALYPVTRQHIGVIVNGGAWEDLPFDADLTTVKRATQTKGEEQTFAKLTTRQVGEIRVLARIGISRQEIAANFGVSNVTVGHILNRKTWKHVP